MAFVHLHTHTQFSLLDGSGRIPELVGHAKEMGMNSLSITDHGSMFGVIDFYKEARKQGIRPIIGCEVYVTGGSRFDREKSEERYYHLILLCENNTGYSNLLKIVSRGYIDGFYYKPRVDMETLREFHEGLIASSACLAGEIARSLTKSDYDEAKKAALRYLEIFGNDHFYLELQDHGYPDQKTVNAGLLRMHGETGIPLIATNDVHYTYADDAEAHDVLLCIQTGKKVSDEDRMRYEGGQFYLKSEEEMRALFPYAPEALDNTQKIADRCCVEIEFGNYKLPHFHVPEGYDAKSYLTKQCEEGLLKRYPDTHEKHRARLEYELGVINSMGFTDYFLIVSDFIRYAKTKGIPVGPGRGSAAGSVVAYCLEITNIDPIRFDLLFERFLNPERVTMPDIDVDFCYERREEVIEYVIRTYGADNVAQIITFGTLAARGVIRDVGRALDVSYADCDKIAKLIPVKPGTSLREVIDTSPELRTMAESDPLIRRLLEMSLRLEGLPRHASMHAAGVLIAGDRVDKYVPLSRNNDGTIVTQYTMVTLEELGLLKMDFLGLRTLTVIREALNQIEKNHGMSVDIDSIDLGDRKVYEMLSAGDTMGVFQLESPGMTSFMKELKPGCIDDIIAGLALYRPGPMDFIPKYIAGKNDPKAVQYDSPELIPILNSTYGCIVYQEQVMQIVQKLAGYTLGRADLVRRAMSKKKHEVMQKERKNFVYGNEAESVPGCISRGISEDTANLIFDRMTDFASYAFNKSHAACYAVVSYQTAWLKYYYPSEFFAALMTSVMDNLTKTSVYMQKLRNIGIRLLPPDINRGDYSFTAVDPKSILYGLSAIKGVGRSAIEDLTKERLCGGPFTDLENFVERMPASFNKKTVECLIKAGAFDTLTGNRKQKLLLMQTLIDSIQSERKYSMAGQMSLFDFCEGTDGSSLRAAMPDVEEFSKDELLKFEKEAAGIYLTGNPIDSYLEEYKKIVNTTSIDFEINEDTGESGLHEGQPVICGGIVSEVKTKTTKNGRQMAFVTVEDLYGTFQVLAFPESYERNRSLFTAESRIYIRGKATIGRDEEASVIPDYVVSFGDVRKEIWFAFADMKDYSEKQNRLEALSASHPGHCEIVVFLRNDKAMKKLGTSRMISGDEVSLEVYKSLFGIENVKIRVAGI